MYTKYSNLGTQFIDIEPDFDFEVLAISCHEKDYRLAWAMNVHFGWSLTCDKDHAVLERGVRQNFERFTYRDDAEGLMYVLLSNNSVWGKLLPEYSGFDFFLLISGRELIEKQEIKLGLRKIPFVLALMELQLENVKSKHNLLIE